MKKNNLLLITLIFIDPWLTSTNMIIQLQTFLIPKLPFLRNNGENTYLRPQFRSLVDVDDDGNDNKNDYDDDDDYSYDDFEYVNFEFPTHNISKEDIDCSFTDSKTKAEFDLSELTVISNTEQSYKYTEQAGTSTPTYLFNICYKVTQASKPMPCIWTYSFTGAAIEFQGPSCFVLGRYKKQSFALIDDEDPTAGVSIKYINGDFCSMSTKRDTVVNVYCANTLAEVKNVEEPRSCSYSINMESYYGCPKSCPVNYNGLCSSQGTCEYNKSIKKSYCKCNNGYYGDDCSSTNAADAIDINVASGSDAWSVYYSYSRGYSNKQVFFIVIMSILVFSIILIVGYKLFGDRGRRSRVGYQQIPAIVKNENY
jgi:hypothetical protein